MFSILLLIYIGTLFYTSAAYLHLKLKHWTFLKAFLIALPLVLLEYQFSLRGNHLANTILRFSPLQILLVTMCFYFVNLWIINHFILKQEFVWYRDLLAFVLVLAAFMISTGFAKVYK